MEVVNRKVEIIWKYNPDTFSKINMDILGETHRKIGSSVSAVNKMLGYPDMLRALMPQILGLDPSSRDVNWDARVKYYWDSLSVDIPSGGKKIEAGFQFDLDDLTRERHIKEVVEKHKITTDKQLADFVMGFTNDKPNVPEGYRWKYGNPINVEEYLLWRYILNYRHVANNIKDANKSPNIRFYLHTEEERQRAEKQKRKLKTEAMTKYVAFINKGSVDSIDDLIAVFSPDSIIDIVKGKDLEEKQVMIMDLVTNDPARFLSLITDKNVSTKAKIERFLAFGVLKKLSGTTVIVESADPSVVIGNNIDEAIAFFNNTKNNAKIDELTGKYKSLISK